MSDTRQLLLKIGEKLNRKPQDMEAYIKTMEDNWYDTIESLKQLTDQQFDALKFPHRLVQEIKAAIAPQPIIPQPTITPQYQPILAPQYQPNPVIPQAVNKDMPKQDDYEVTHQQFTIMLRSILIELKEETLAGYSDCLTVLSKIIQNIVENPNDETKRRLKASNMAFYSKVGKFSMAHKFMKSIGFVKNTEGFSMPYQNVNVELLVVAFNILKEIYCQVESLNYSQDSTQQQMVTSINPILKPDDPSLYNPNLLEKEKQRVLNEKKAQEAKKIEDRKIMIYPRVQEQKMVQPDEYDSDKDDGTVGALTLLKKNEEDRHFQSRAMKELGNLKKRKVFSAITIKIRYPGDLILQAIFSPYETLSDIYSFVREHSAARNEFVLMIPPKKIIGDVKELLKKHNLAPAATMILQGDMELSTEALTKYLIK